MQEGSLDRFLLLPWTLPCFPVLGDRVQGRQAGGRAWRRAAVIMGGDAAPAWGLMEGGRPPRSGARDPSQREAGYAAGSSGMVASAGFMQGT